MTLRLRLLRGTAGTLRKNLGALLLMLRALTGIARRRRLRWLLHLLEERVSYKVDALFSGIMMNRRGEGNLYSLRRNLHRLEKGLCTPQQRDVFAEGYILETVEYLVQSRLSVNPDPNMIVWADAVLQQYFETCRHTEQVAKAYRLYQDWEPENRHPDRCPYPASRRPDLFVQYDALYQLALRRRSVRHYLDRAVEFNLVQDAMRVAALSPSACNRQPFRFLFFDQKDFVRSIAEIPGGAEGYELPSILVVIGSYRAFFDERDVNVPFIDASLASMSFILALETVGLSSVCINWPSLPDRDRRIRQLINLEEDEFVIMLIGVGYPDPEGLIPYSAKRDLSQLIACNERIVA